MAFAVGTKAQCDAFNQAVNQTEGLPRPPDAWPPGFDPRLDWVPTEEEPNPPAGWTARYYEDPSETNDNRWAIPGYETKHAAEASAAGVSIEEEVTFKPWEEGQ